MSDKYLSTRTARQKFDIGSIAYFTFIELFKRKVDSGLFWGVIHSSLRKEICVVRVVKAEGMVLAVALT